MTYWYFLFVWSVYFGSYDITTRHWGLVYLQSFFAVFALLMISKANT